MSDTREVLAELKSLTDTVLEIRGRLIDLESEIQLIQRKLDKISKG